MPRLTTIARLTTPPASTLAYACRLGAVGNSTYPPPALTWSSEARLVEITIRNGNATRATITTRARPLRATTAAGGRPIQIGRPTPTRLRRVRLVTGVHP